MPSRIKESRIINRGRGPEIEGTRITVYDVMDYRKHGWNREVIASFFRLSSRDIQAAFDYIDEHAEEVQAQYKKILERSRNYKYSPEVQAKIDKCRGTARRRIQEIRARKTAEEQHAEDYG